MSPAERVQMMLDCISNVKLKAKEAARQGDFCAYKMLMEDLLALECSLVSETEALMEALSKVS